MKKNKMMRTASVLLVLTLLTVCVISGTFAKYVTKAEGTDTARVAKWGVSITSDGNTFANEYATDDQDVVGTISKSVISTDKKDVVAPGTKGSLANMTIAGTPEVAVDVKYEGAFTLDDNWTVDGDFYCPLIIKVGQTEIKQGATVGDVKVTSAATFNQAVNNTINAYSKQCAPNTNLGETLSISWEWPFSSSDANDTKDTALGNATTPGNVTLAVKATVTQID